jgi:hypothetical protein
MRKSIKSDCVDPATLRHNRSAGRFRWNYGTFTLARRLIGGHGMRALLSVFVFLVLGVSAHAQIYHGNDAITLSLGNEFEAHLIAAQFCARGDKYTIIRVHKRSGDAIAINCLAAPPATRSASIQPAEPAQPAMNQITELFAQFRSRLTALSAAAQPEMPAGEKEPPPPPERDSTVTGNTYAQPW